MAEAIRGTIHSLERYKQLIDFSGLRFERNITPTDFDAAIDFGSKEWVLIEYKHKGNPLSSGQRRCLESALLAHQKSGIKALGIVANHSTEADEVIDGASCNVIEVWSNGQWRTPRVQRTVKETIDFWRSYQ